MTDTTALEAAAFRRLLQHLRQRSDVQNIDLMIHAGFCRNCLSTWLQEASTAAGTPMDREQADRILSAIEQDERELTRDKLRRGQRRTPVLRDW